MIEILFLMFFTRRIGAVVSAKGVSPGGYKALAVALWIGGEVIGAIAGVSLGADGGGLYVGALLGAGCGALIAWLVANGVESRKVDSYDVGAPYVANGPGLPCQYCKSIVPPGAARCPICAGQPAQAQPPVSSQS